MLNKCGQMLRKTPQRRVICNNTSVTTFIKCDNYMTTGNSQPTYTTARSVFIKTFTQLELKNRDFKSKRKQPIIVVKCLEFASGLPQLT